MGNACPVVVPRLQRWDGGAGVLPRAALARVVSDEAGLRDRLVQEIGQVTGLTLAAAGGPAGAGDVVLTLDPALTCEAGGARFAEEGYLLAVTGEQVRISAPTATGLFYGTRSLLQILRTTAELPVGAAADWPDYPVRGFMLDVGRRFFTPGFVREQLAVMGWFKLNELQLHLNDNGFLAPDGTWSEVQAGFRLVPEDPALAGLASADGAYDRADWDSFEEAAAAEGVTLVPEIDAPAHALAFVRFRPSLGLGDDHLDLSKPESTQFVKDLFTEFVPWFRGPHAHFGADEYLADEPRYKEFFNAMAAHLRALGKRPRAWGSLTRMAGGVPEGYDPDVVINCWATVWYGPHEARRDGYSFVNTSDSLLYIVPAATYYHPDGLDGEYLYDHWAPHVFPDGQSVAPGDPRLLGAMSAVWNDITAAPYTEDDVRDLVEPTFAVLAQKMWSGAGGMPYHAFMDAVREAGGPVGP
ncbi:beta-N-acetylhexosaminidase [Actinomadura sp. ATCC 39365]